MSAGPTPAPSLHDPASAPPSDPDPGCPTLYTLEEIAVAWGISKERVRQLEERALRKLKRGLAEVGITSAEDFRCDD